MPMYGRGLGLNWGGEYPLNIVGSSTQEIRFPCSLGQKVGKKEETSTLSLLSLILCFNNQPDPVNKVQQSNFIEEQVSAVSSLRYPFQRDLMDGSLNSRG